MHRELDPRLRADSHVLGRLRVSQILLHRDSAVAWFIVVPDTSEQNLLALPVELLNQIMADCRVVSDFIVDDLGYPKVNVASIGNVVAQMHVHVVGRRPGDACWPMPVWGKLTTPVAYSTQLVENFTRGLGLRGLQPIGATHIESE